MAPTRTKSAIAMGLFQLSRPQLVLFCKILLCAHLLYFYCYKIDKRLIYFIQVVEGS